VDFGHPGVLCSRVPTSLDFETYYNKKEGLGIKQQGMQRYVRDPRFDAYFISVYDGETAWAGHRNRFNWDALDGQVLLSHNAAFDSSVYEELVKRGQAPRLKIPEWHCTANLSTYVCSRRDLGRAAEFLFGVKLDKSVRGDADGKTWEMLSAEDGGKSMTEYAKQDAIYCWRIWNEFSHLWPTRERRISELTIRQCRRGAQIDTVKLEQFYSVACKMLVQAESVLPWMKEGKKPTSPIAVAAQCRMVNIPPPPVKTRDGEEAYDLWAAEYAPKHQWVKAYTDYRVINKFITTLETLRARLYEDGCFPFDLLYFGAHTGRWSGSGGFNMQNMRKEPLYCDNDGWLVTDPVRLIDINKGLERFGVAPDWVQCSLDIRALFTARPGRQMIISDLSQIEPRVLAWLVKDKAMLEMMSRGQSPYEAHARATMGWTGGMLKKENKDLYALAKARVLGLGYGCGWEKFITVAYDMAGIDITVDDPEEIHATNQDGNLCYNTDGSPKMLPGYGSNSKRIVKEYREQNPLIASNDPDSPGIWRRLDQAFRDSEGGDFTITLPSGRELRYPNVRCERKATVDPDNPARYIFKRCYTADVFNPKKNAVIRENLYGGKLTENLVQATARDIFADQLLALDDQGIDPLWNVHDEAVNEADLSVTAEDVRHVMSQTPEYMPGLPVDAEANVVPHYRK